MNNNTFIIAEAGVNHCGDFKKAVLLCEKAFEIKASAIKFQTFSSRSLVTEFAELCDYQKESNNYKKNQKNLLEGLELKKNEFIKLSKKCELIKIEFMSTAFDEENLKFLINDAGIKRIKIPSGEIINPLLLLEAARSKLPIILSTGASTLKEIKNALKILSFGFLNKKGIPNIHDINKAYADKDAISFLKKKVSLLHCVSSYPCPIDEINLLSLAKLKKTFKLKIGLSDHSLGTVIPISAVSMGAEIIEKHFTLNKKLSGPDHKISLTPVDFKKLIENIRIVERAIGKDIKKPQKSELKNIKNFRGSIVARSKIKKGEKFSIENLCIKRPSTGLNPLNLLKINNTKAEKDYDKDEIIK